MEGNSFKFTRERFFLLYFICQAQKYFLFHHLRTTMIIMTIATVITETEIAIIMIKLSFTLYCTLIVLLITVLFGGGGGGLGFNEEICIKLQHKQSKYFVLNVIILLFDELEVIYQPKSSRLSTVSPEKPIIPNIKILTPPSLIVAVVC